MKHLILIGILLLGACEPHETKKGAQSKIHLLYIDTSKYAILKFNSKNDSGLFDNRCKPAILTADDIDQIEKIIADTVKGYNNLIRKNNQNYNLGYSFINRPDNYYKQFITVSNLQGEKEVWVNCFCYNYLKANGQDADYWKKGIIRVNDGGNCFFQLKINLTRNVLKEFNVNGLA